MKKLIMILVATSIILPIILLILFSMFSYYRFPLLFPKNLTFSFWRSSVLHNPLFFSSLRNSIIIGVCNGLCSTFFGIMTARALVSYEFKGKCLIKRLVTVPLFIPAIALFLGLHIVLLRLRLVNSLCGIVIAHVIISLPYAINIFISFFRGISPDMEAVATTLGCGDVKIFKRIILPLIMPGIYLSFSLSFLISFSEYFSSFLMGGGRVITFATLMYPYLSNNDIGNGSVLGIVFIGINALVFFITESFSRKKLKIESYLFE